MAQRVSQNANLVLAPGTPKPRVSQVANLVLCAVAATPPTAGTMVIFVAT